MTPPRAARLALLLLLPILAASSCGPAPGPDPLPDSAELYIGDSTYRRAILERDLLTTDNFYAERRLGSYAVEGAGWDNLPERDLPSRPLTSEDVERLQQGLGLEMHRDQMTSLSPATLPDNEAGWQDLGRRVMEEYPLRPDPLYETLVSLPGALTEVGFIEDNGGWMGLRVFESESGAARVAPACSQCHFSRDDEGLASATLANKQMDIGRAFLLALGHDPDVPLPEDEDSPIADLHRLGPGRGDLLLGWDTDQFPNDVTECTLALLEVLEAGGFTTGGLNFVFDRSAHRIH